MKTYRKLEKLFAKHGVADFTWIRPADIVVSKSGRPEPPQEKPTRWTPASLAVAEALPVADEEPRSRAARSAAESALVRIAHHYGAQPEFVALGGLIT